MKKTIISFFVIALMTASSVRAQQISVVSSKGATRMYQTLAEAIKGAADGSVIYLPGGGFQIADSVKITKKVSIIGIGHKAVSENADGNTVISGNLFFEHGSDNSAVMGCYISGDVHIGKEGNSVNNILIKLCNLTSVRVWNTSCSGTIVNQNYIRGGSFFNNGSADFSNNVAYSLGDLQGGTIENNIFTNNYLGYQLNNCKNCTISNNVFLYYGSGYIYGSNNLTFGNMTTNKGCGDDPIHLGVVDWNDVFVNYNKGAVTPASDFHFKGDYKQYSDCGIYGGSGFDSDALPPVPYIVSKNIASQTDASGMLSIKVRVKAGE